MPGFFYSIISSGKEIFITIFLIDANFVILAPKSFDYSGPAACNTIAANAGRQNMIGVSKSCSNTNKIQKVNSKIFQLNFILIFQLQMEFFSVNKKMEVITV